MTANEDNERDASERDEQWPVDGLDRLIAGAARDYHTPPATVPRDAMWAAIVAARIPAAPDAAPAVASPIVVQPTVVRSIDSAPSRRLRSEARTWWAIAAAAVIFLATGVAVGRWSARPGVAPASQVAATTSAPSTPAAPTPIDSTAPVAPTSVDGRVGNVTVPATHVASAATTRPSRRDGADRGDDAYDVAVVHHFAQAEALLVSYRADTADAALDGQLAKWARPLLGDTRLLLDSPAAADPRRRRLLEDLELVLAQVARLAPRDSTASDSVTRADRAERQLIDGAMRHAQLLPRLRTAVPAGSDL